MYRKALCLAGLTFLLAVPSFAQSATTATPYIFEGGYPIAQTGQRARDDSDFQRAIIAYRFWYPPAGQEGLWIKTTPGRGWFAYLRIYGPEQAAFDGSWKPGDFERTGH
jgi:hypothetical protein